MDCIFCKIANGETNCHKIYEDDKAMAFLDISDDFEGHTLVVPKKHIANFNESSNCQITHLIKVAKQISQHYVDLGYEGTNIVINNGEAAEQSVHHLHIHVIPRRKGDGKLYMPLHSRGTDLQKLAKKLRIK